MPYPGYLERVRADHREGYQRAQMGRPTVSTAKPSGYRQVLHPGMHSTPDTILKPMMSPGQLNEEMRTTSFLMRATGGVIPYKPEPYSAITGAITKNEELTKEVQAKERAREAQQAEQQRITAQRYHAKNEAIHREFEAQQEAYKDGAVSYALYNINRLYAPQVERPQPSQPRGGAHTTITRNTDGTMTRQAYNHSCSECGMGAGYSWKGKYYCERHTPW
jgi:hypothetical protein